MKILMINVVCGIKSTGRICTDIAQTLEEQGHEVKIAYGREEVPSHLQHFAVQIGIDLDSKLHGVLSRTLDGVGLGSKAATKRFIQWIREFDPDIIHLHNLHGYYIHVPTLFDYLKSANKKVIWTLHDMWPFTGHSPACDQAACEKWRSGCGNCPMRGDYPKSFTDFSARNFRWKKEAFLGLNDLTLVSPSNWLASLAEQSFLGCYDVKVIPNGIDTSVFRPVAADFKEKHGLTGKKIILGIAGNWHDTRKGFPDFMALAARLPEDTHIVMVGIPEDLKDQLPSNVLGIPKTHSVQELAAVYSAADVLLNPTYSDNFPTVNLEALCCGTPVLTYRTGGSPEPIREGWGGAADQGSLDQILALLPEVMEMQPDTALARQLFSKERAIEEYSKLYFD